MKILIAPDSFKECLDVFSVTDAIARGLLSGGASSEDIIRRPLADGGEGLLQVLVHAAGGSIHEKSVSGPLGEKVRASFALLSDGKTAVIEMAQAAGIHLIDPEKRNPLFTTTYGVGELMRSALDAGARRLIVGLGGSATNDGGAGMAQALGVSLKNHEGEELSWGGAALASLAVIDCSRLDPRLKSTEVIGACDVTSPLCGARGASVVYGPQKGADAEQVAVLDAALRHYGFLLEAACPPFHPMLPGAGAAGGLGAGLAAFAGAALRSGIDLVLSAYGDFEEHCADAAAIISGEGRVDGQSTQGKVLSGVAGVARRHGVPLFVLVGKISGDLQTLYDAGVTAVFPIAPFPMEEKEALRTAAAHLEQTARNLMRTVAALKRKKQ